MLPSGISVLFHCLPYREHISFQGAFLCAKRELDFPHLQEMQEKCRKTVYGVGAIFRGGGFDHSKTVLETWLIRRII